MASLKLTVFLMVALAYASTVYCDDEILDTVHEKFEEGKKKIIEETQTEKKGFFDSFKEKVSEYYDVAKEKGEAAIQKTGDVISKGYNNLKEKAKDLIKKDPESVPSTDKLPDVPN